MCCSPVHLVSLFPKDNCPIIKNLLFLSTEELLSFVPMRMSLDEIKIELSPVKSIMGGLECWRCEADYYLSLTFGITPLLHYSKRCTGYLKLVTHNTGIPFAQIDLT